MGNSQSTTGEHQFANPQNGSEFRMAKFSSPAGPHDSSSPSSCIEDPKTSRSPSIAAPLTADGISDQGAVQQTRMHALALEERQSPGIKHSQLDLLAANVVRSLSRSGSRAKSSVSARSSMAKLQAGSQLPVVNDTAVDLQSAIAIIQELRKTASPEDLAALHRALLPVASRESLAPIITNEGQEELNAASTSLIRRKSFAQPGVATRLAKPERKVLRKPVPPPSSQSETWTRDMMGASPLARLSSLDAPTLGELEPPPELYENRARTPTDLDYSQLGNLKHGSLKVVNGPPSPNPSVATPGNARRIVSDEHNEDFFTASEHSGSRPGSKHNPDLTPEMAWRHEPSLGDMQFRGRGQIQDARPRERDGSPLKQQLRHTGPEMSSDADVEGVYPSDIEPTRSQDVSHSQLTKRFSFEEPGENEVCRSITKHQSQSAVCLATEYMSEMPPSPYKTQVGERDKTPVSPTEDSYDEVRPPIIHGQIIVTRPDNVRDVPPISPRKPLRSNPTLEDVPTLVAMRPQRPLGVKTDSGYSSSASASVVDSMSPVKKRQSNLSTVESLAKDSHQQRLRPSRGAVDLAIRIGQITSPPNAPIAGANAGADADADADAEPGIIESVERDEATGEKVKRTKSWRKSVRRSLPRLLSSESTGTAVSKPTSASASPSSEQKPRKLQKRRPLSQPPIGVGDRHIVDMSIPRVPSTVFSRYSDRLSASPGMQYLEQTYENTIDSQDSSVDPNPSAAKTALPLCFFPDAGLDDPPPAPAPRLSFKRPSFLRSRTQFDKQEVLSAGIADFGTVSKSLDTSPYDAAYSGPRRSIFGGAIQPHHLSTRAVRSGPREGWDAETASKFAQVRSHERATQQYVWEQQSNAERRSMPPRPISYHVDMPKTVMQRPQNAPMQRPKSMHAQQMFTAPEWSNHRPDGKSVHPVPMPSQHQHQPRPRTSHHDREASPVKKLVSVYEQKASEAPAPPPMPSPQPNWSNSSRIWRERRLNAQTNVSSMSASPQSQVMATTTTTVTAFSSSIPRTTTTTTVVASRPVIQNRKSLTQLRQSQPAISSHGEGNLAGSSGVDLYNGESNDAAPMAKRRDVAPNSSAARRFHGVDFGDVPVRVI